MRPPQMLSGDEFLLTLDQTRGIGKRTSVIKQTFILEIHCFRGELRFSTLR